MASEVRSPGWRPGFSLVRVATLVAVIVAGSLVTLKLAFTQPFVGTIVTSVPHAADPESLRAHVEFLCADVYPRNTDHPDNLDRAADYIAAAFAKSAGRVSEQVFQARRRTYRNIIVSFGPETREVFVIGAHYDVFGDLPGADDNASGVASLIELSRLLGAAPPSHRVDLVAYSLEEPPFFGSSQMGSAVHARMLVERGARIRGMIAVEMVGFFTDEQPWDNLLLQAIYRNRGDFVMFAGRWSDRALAAQAKRSFRGASATPVLSFVGPSALASDASDHRSYWEADSTAVMLTDTATIRNHNYHTANDRPETLDYLKMASVVEGLYGVAMQLTERNLAYR